MQEIKIIASRTTLRDSKLCHKKKKPLRQNDALRGKRKKKIKRGIGKKTHYSRQEHHDCRNIAARNTAQKSSKELNLWFS